MLEYITGDWVKTLEIFFENHVLVNNTKRAKQTMFILAIFFMAQTLINVFLITHKKLKLKLK